MLNGDGKRTLIEEALTEEARAKLSGRDPIAHDDPNALATSEGWANRQIVPPAPSQEILDAAADREEIDHPSHYTSHPSGVECVTIAEHFSFNVGNAIKYLWRHGQKPGVDVVTDLRKAIWYIEREIARIEGEA